MNKSSLTSVYSLRTIVEHQTFPWRRDINVVWSDISPHTATKIIGLYESASVILTILNLNTNWYKISVIYQQDTDSLRESTMQYTTGLQGLSYREILYLLDKAGLHAPNRTRTPTVKKYSILNYFGNE